MGRLPDGWRVALPAMVLMLGCAVAALWFWPG